MRSARRAWAHVGGVRDAHVEVAAWPLRAIIDLLILARNDPSKGVGDAVFDLPVEDLGVEGARGVDVIRREVDEDEKTERFFRVLLRQSARVTRGDRRAGEPKSKNSYEFCCRREVKIRKRLQTQQNFGPLGVRYIVFQ